MRWVEIINARFASLADTSEAGNLIADIRSSLKADECKSLKMVVLRGLFVDSDMAIHLHWETRLPPSGRTGIGIKLAEIIKPMALLDHSIWIEDHGEK